MLNKRGTAVASKRPDLNGNLNENEEKVDENVLTIHDAYKYVLLMWSLKE